MKRELTEICYGFFSTLANPTRLAILEKLTNTDMNVTQLTTALGQEQSMISHNLKPLIRCRLVRPKKRGKARVYSLNKDIVGKLFEIVEYHKTTYCVFKGKCPDSH